MTSGKIGENAAANYLIDKGYEIKERNFRACGVELDLVALKDETLCIVEVKTRKTEDYGIPIEFVDRRKRRRIIRGTKVLISRDEYQNFYVRFDIISVIYQGGELEITHIEHAFEEE